MSSVDTLVKGLKDSASALWYKAMGKFVERSIVSTEDIQNALKEASGAVKEAFANQNCVSMETVGKAAVDAGVRAMAGGELHKRYQLSRAVKVQAAVNTAAYIVKEGGGLDIMRGKTKNA